MAVIKKFLYLSITIIFLLILGIFLFHSKIEKKIFEKIINKAKDKLSLNIDYELARLDIYSGHIILNNIKISDNNKQITINNIKIISRQSIFLSLITNKAIIDLKIKNINIKGENLEKINDFFSNNKNLNLLVSIKNIFDEKKDIFINISKIKYFYNYKKDLSLLSAIKKINIYAKTDEDKIYFTKINIIKPQFIIKNFLKNEKELKKSNKNAFDLLKGIGHFIIKKEKNIFKKLKPKNNNSSNLELDIKDSLYIKELNIEKAKIIFLDESINKPNKISLSNIQIKINEIYFPSNKYADIKYSFNIDDASGKLDGYGKIIPNFDKFNFNLNTNIYDITLKYFESYYRPKIDIEILSGSMSMTSIGECKNNELLFKQEVVLHDLKIVEESSAPVIFGLNQNEILSVLKNKNNTIKFRFNITGNIKDSDFRFNINLEDAIAAVFKANIANALNILKTSGNNTKNVEDTIKNIGKNIKNMLLGTINKSDQKQNEEE